MRVINNGTKISMRFSTAADKLIPSTGNTNTRMNAKSSHRSRASTRIECLALITVILLLSALAFPSSANNRGHTRTTLCLSNLKHLAFAWQLYATDHDGLLVGNFTGGDAISPPAPFTGWAAGWLDWTTSSQNTNVNNLRNPRFARLSDYILTEKNVHKCPSDTFQSAQQRSRGMHRVRSVGMNSTLGSGNVMNGPWDPIYQQVKTIGAIQFPSPAETTLIFDEHPDSINDPLVYAPSRTQWIDIPGNLHNGAGSFSFTDGHVALRPWRTPGIRNLRVRYSFVAPIVRTGDPDISWMSYTSQRRSAQHY